MRSVAFVDAPAGCAGDMFLGALVDLGLPTRALEEVVTALGLEGVEIRSRKVMRGPLAAVKVDVVEPAHVHGADPDHDHGHRGLAEIVELIRRARGLEPEALADATRTFRLLADAEAKVHGTTPEEVHFHEVGAVDALVDIVGTCVGLRRLGVTEVRVSPLPWGSGSVGSAHGLLPLPAPAVVHLLEGHPTFPSGATAEEVTPTGAALVRALSAGSAVPAGFAARRVGVGAGTRETGRLPNALRLVLGEVAGDETPADALLLETNLDDLSGQGTARVIERALEEGALDAWAVPAVMKKGRPGIVLSLLVEPGAAARFEALLFRETPTLGVRRRAVARTVLARREVTVRTPFGEVRVKVREAPDGPEGTPEYEDCRRLAERAGVPWRRVAEAAATAYAAGRTT